MRTIPVTLLGGYLGSGKTTLVNSVLRLAAARADEAGSNPTDSGTRIAVLINDFGTLPIDADLIEAEDGDLISLAGGCVCCSYGDDLSMAMEQIRRMTPPPDHVLLETSGVALPGAIAASLALQPGVRVDAVVVLADADAIRSRHRSEYLKDTVERQLFEASLVVITKSDLVTANRLSDLREWLPTLAPHASVISAQDQSVPLDVLLGCDGVLLSVDMHTHAHHHLGSEHDHSHDHAHALYETHAFQSAEPFDVERLANALAGVDGVLRAKGFVRDKAGKLKIMQVVGKRADVLDAADNVQPGWVVIGLKHEIDRNSVEALADQFRIAAHKRAG